MTSIYDLSWNRSDFLSKLVLVLKSEWAMLTAKKADKVNVLSALSSTYYTVAGTASKALRREVSPSSGFLLWDFWISSMWSIFWLCSWAPLGLFCYWQMLPVSNKMLKLAGGYEPLSVGQLDVRQSILRKKKRWDDALFCVDWALRKRNPIGHSLALLLVGKADILERRNKDWGNFGEIKNLTHQAIKIAEEVEESEPHQSIRIYKNCADLWERMNEDGQLLRDKARSLAKRVGAKDQLLKMK